MTSTTTTLDYPIVRNKPVADFRYKGSHSKPVRRRVVLTEITSKTFSGYEIREGNITRDLEEAEIKTFSRDKIMNGTLERSSLKESGLESEFSEW